MEIIIYSENEEVVVETTEECSHLDLAVSLRVIADEIEREALKPKLVRVK